MGLQARRSSYVWLSPVSQACGSGGLARYKASYSRFDNKEQLRRIRAELVTVRDLILHGNLHQMYRLVHQVRERVRAVGHSKCDALAFSSRLIVTRVGVNSELHATYVIMCAHHVRHTAIRFTRVELPSSASSSQASSRRRGRCLRASARSSAAMSLRPAAGAQ